MKTNADDQGSGIVWKLHSEQENEFRFIASVNGKAKNLLF